MSEGISKTPSQVFEVTETPKTSGLLLPAASISSAEVCGCRPGTTTWQCRTRVPFSFRHGQIGRGAIRGEPLEEAGTSSAFARASWAPGARGGPRTSSHPHSSEPRSAANLQGTRLLQGSRLHQGGLKNELDLVLAAGQRAKSAAECACVGENLPAALQAGADLLKAWADLCACRAGTNSCASDCSLGGCIA